MIRLTTPLPDTGSQPPVANRTAFCCLLLQLGVLPGQTAGDIMAGSYRRFYPHSGAPLLGTSCALAAYQVRPCCMLAPKLKGLQRWSRTTISEA